MHFIFVFLLFCLLSCRSKYTADRYIIQQPYRDLIASYKPGDTLKFKDNNGNLTQYFITNIDSSFVEAGNGFMRTRGWKEISVNCCILPCDSTGINQFPLMLLNRYPDEDSAAFKIRLQDFYSIDTTEPFILRTDTTVVNDLSVTNYYSFRPDDFEYLKNPVSVSRILVTKERGIIAYSNVNGVWWTRVQ